MAIIKEIINDQGIRTTYHKVAKLEVDIKARIITVYVHSFIDEIQRNVERSNEEQDAYIVDRYKEVSVIKTELESLIKTNDDNKNAESIAEKAVLIDQIETEIKEIDVVIHRKFHVDEYAVDVEYTDPLSIESIYNALIQSDSVFSGGEKD